MAPMPKQTRIVDTPTLHKVKGIPASQVSKVWAKVRPLIRNGLKRSGGRLSETTVYDALVNGQMRLWIGVRNDEVEMVMVTWIATYPTGFKCLQVVLLAGSRPEAWLQFEPELEAWAREQGCHRIEAWARPGWERVLKHYRKRYVMLERELTDGTY